MKKIFLSALVMATSFASNQVFASEDYMMKCEITETIGSKSQTQVVEAPFDADSAHGTIANFKLNQIEKTSGFVAYVKGNAVINLNMEATGFNASSVGYILNGSIAHMQFYIPGPADAKVTSLSIDCSLAMR